MLKLQSGNTAQTETKWQRLLAQFWPEILKKINEKEKKTKALT